MVVSERAGWLVVGRRSVDLMFRDWDSGLRCSTLRYCGDCVTSKIMRSLLVYVMLCYVSTSGQELKSESSQAPPLEWKAVCGDSTRLCNQTAQVNL
jgi:hypothetical protein